MKQRWARARVETTTKTYLATEICIKQIDSSNESFFGSDNLLHVTTRIQISTALLLQQNEQLRGNIYSWVSGE